MKNSLSAYLLFFSLVCGNAASWDDALMTLRSGKPLSPTEVEACRQDFGSYGDSLSQRNGGKSSLSFAEPDLTNFFVNAMKMSLIDSRDQGGWGFVSDHREKVVDLLRARAENPDDLSAQFAYIFPALTLGRYSDAAATFENLRTKDPWLAAQAIRLAAQMASDPMWFIDNYLAVGKTAEALEVGEMAAASGTLSGSEMKALLMEKLGRLQDAEHTYEEIRKTYKTAGPLAAFLMRCSARNDGAGFSERFRKLQDQAFPSGTKQLDKSRLTTRPIGGVEFRSSENYGDVVKSGSVVVAVEDRIVENSDQLLTLCESDPTRKLVNLTLWDGTSYQQLAVPPSVLQRLSISDIRREAEMQ